MILRGMLEVMDAQKAGKHAYLILYHKNSEQLLRLIKALDDQRNDIYIHADRKTEDFPEEKLCDAVQFSKLYFTKRIYITWGGYSLVRATMRLLKEATDNAEYVYYHLLSAQDMPIKSQDYIHSYFYENSRREFIRINTCLKNDMKLQEKLSFYRFFQEISRRNNGFFSGFFRKVEKCSLIIQKRLKINRIRGKEDHYYRGSEWFSITQDFAKYILKQKKWIRKNFLWTNCPDEMFVQSIVMRSPFQSSLHPFMRLIDWKRGSIAHPYVFRLSDFEMIAESDCLFARKFDADADSKIIDRIIEELCRKDHSRSD